MFNLTKLFTRLTFKIFANDIKHKLLLGDVRCLWSVFMKCAFKNCTCLLVPGGRARGREQLSQCWPVPVLVSGSVARYKVERRPLAVWAPVPAPRHCHHSLTLSPVWMEARRERAAHCSQQSVHTAAFLP